MFLEMDVIQGEAQDKGHKGHAGAIQVLGWAFEMSNTLSASAGGGGGAGKVAVHDISITKWVDKATTEQWNTPSKEEGQVAQFQHLNWTSMAQGQTGGSQTKKPANSSQPFRGPSGFCPGGPLV